MRDVNEYAKFFLKKSLDDNPNTFDGNMKLQKLLFFANLINYSRHNALLFEEEMLAFENGTVIEEVRKRYRNDYYTYKQDARDFNPDFTQEEYDTLNDTINIFGNLSARELSELNHQFEFWNKKFEQSTNENGYHEKKLAVITEKDIKPEIRKISEILSSYEENNQSGDSCELINGITFYYNPSDISIEDILPNLESFSLHAEDTVYSVLLDEDSLVIM